MKFKKVLLIDDSEIDNYINKAIIEKAAYVSSIEIETSALDALEYLNKIKNKPHRFPDIIFLNIRMPEMNGFEFMEEYVKLPDEIRRNCEVFLLSSSIDPLDSLRAKKFKDIKKHLTKPLAHHPLSEIIDFGYVE